MTAAEKQARVHFRTVPGLDALSLQDDRVLLRSEAGVVKIEGSMADAFLTRLLSYAGRWRSREALHAFFTEFGDEDLDAQLEALVRQGVLCRRDGVAGDDGRVDEDNDGERDPFAGFLDLVGIPSHEAIEVLRGSSVAIYGLEHAAAHAAVQLAQCGVGEIRLIDPFPLQHGDIACVPGATLAAVGLPRQEVVRDAVARAAPATRCVLPIDDATGARGLDRARATESARGCRLLIAAFDRGFSAAQQWVNRASLETGVPALFAELGGHRALLGPMVLPGESGCYLCWRMRYLAARPSFGDAMAFEEHDRRRLQPVAHRRPLLPPVATWAGSLLSLEALKTMLALATPGLTDAILELDALSATMTRHRFLQRPDCPACAGVVRLAGAPVDA